MSTSASVQVVLATRNADPQLLQRAVESVLSQEVALELTLVDDGSEPPIDPTGWPDQVRVLRTAGVGVSVARNLGMATSTSPYVAFIDDDDAWWGGKLAIQQAILEANPGTVLVDTEFELVDLEGARLGSGYAVGYRDRLDLLDEGCGICLSSVLVRRSALDSAGGFREALVAGEDWDLFLRLAGEGSFHRVPAPLVSYAVRPDGLHRYWATWAAARLLYREALLRPRGPGERAAAWRGLRRARWLLGSQALAHARHCREVRAPWTLHLGRALWLAPWRSVSEVLRGWGGRQP